MKNNEIAVSIKNMGKTYKIYDSPGQRFKSLLFKKDWGRDFVALDDINIDIKVGEAFAIVGKNGSGKSTMLQILAGILQPTAGEVIVNGRLAALLELGSGFDPESTGYENIYMNAAILGLEKQEIEKKVQDIIEFADIGEHLHEPVKTYSSGMYVRLGFAVAINVEAEILLVDEALAVGDVFFRQKCYTRLNELKAQGTTIILVTHNMSEVEQFCDRAMLLKRGKQIAVDRSQVIVKEYYLQNENNESQSTGNTQLLEGTKNNNAKNIEFAGGWHIQDELFFPLSCSTEIANGKATYLKIGLFDKEGKSRRTFVQGEEAYFYSEINVKGDIEVPIGGITIYNQMNVIVHGKDTSQTYARLPKRVQAGKNVYILQMIKLDIAVGEYTFECGFVSMNYESYEKRSLLSQEELDSSYERICNRNNVGTFTIVGKTTGCPTKNGFHGICELNGETEILIDDGE